MNSVQLRWVYWDRSSQHPPQFAIPIGHNLMHYQVLQYRERLNPMEEGLHDPIWSDWKNV